LAEQRAEFRLGIAIHLQLLAERGGVQTPPLDERRGAAKAAKPRQVDPLALQLELIVMAGHGLTQILRRQNQGRARSALRRVDVKHGRRQTVWRTRQIGQRRRDGLPIRLDAADPELGPGKGGEQCGCRIRNLDLQALVGAQKFG